MVLLLWQKSMEGPQNIKNRITIDLAIPLWGVARREFKIGT
jgi:hypothetical protein